MDRDAISDALIDLERMTAKIAQREGVSIANGLVHLVVRAGDELFLSDHLTNIHARIAKACGLEDPGMKCDCLCHDVEPSGFRHGSHTPDLCVCFGTDFQGEQ